MRCGKAPICSLRGDIRVERESGGFYFPVFSMLVISIVLSILLSLFFRP